MSSPSLPPSTLAIVISTGILGLVTGYFIGQGSSLGLFSSSSKAKKSWPNSYDVTVHPDSSDDELMERLLGERRGRGNGPKGRGEAGGNDSDEGSEDEEEEDERKVIGGLQAFEDSKEQEFKLVLVVRTDLGMQKGKIAAQCAHATLQNYKALLRSPSSASLLRRWEAGGQAKIALQAYGGEEELLSLSEAARREGLCALIVRDAGRTQIASGTTTVLGVGPGPKEVVNRVTGSLKLL